MLIVPLLLLSASGVRAQNDDAGPDQTSAKDVFLVVDPGTHTGRIRSLAFTPGDKLLTFADDRTIQTWDPATGQRLRVHRLPFDLEVPLNGELAGGMAVSPDGRQIVVAGGVLHKDGNETHVALSIHRPSG